MKRLIIFAVAMVATIAVSMKMYSSSKDGKPSNYNCKYDDKKGICTKEAEGWACYGVKEDCSWMD